MVVEIALCVNGQPRTAPAGEGVPLLHVLRNLLDLKATRYGCGQEQCGACMVLLDGKPTFSCTFPATEAAGRNVETAEALATHPLREAFLELQAGQCGYCLSGILMSAKGLLDRTSDPTREEIIAALDPHLCRCGAHGRIIDAVALAAARLGGAAA